jgi:hypothetical protein
VSDWATSYRAAIHNTDLSSRPASAATGEREPETPTPPVVCSGADPSSGSRLRFAAERGSGFSGTAYNRLDWEVVDHDAPAGRRIKCRATRQNAQDIAAALNRADWE